LPDTILQRLDHAEIFVRSCREAAAAGSGQEVAGRHIARSGLRQERTRLNHKRHITL
jgi:hypothetical protein